MDPYSHPRLADLARTSGQAGAGTSYFNGLDDDIRNLSLARDFYDRLEARLSVLPDDAWRTLRDKATPYVSTPHSRRAWEQLMSTLNEVFGFICLSALACRDISFVPERGDGRSPDLRGESDAGEMLLEVKTLHRSDEYYDHRGVIGETAGRWHEIEEGVALGLVEKIRSTLVDAGAQLISDGHSGRNERIAVLVIAFDPPRWANTGRVTRLCELIPSLTPDSIDHVVLIVEETMMSPWSVTT